jgi:hypothetical protein
LKEQLQRLQKNFQADSVPYGFQQDANADEVAKAKAVVKALLG